ncbi:MAG TPA: Na-K-Cl cotransporter [Acidimicrobiia bacterium]|nr:Na-K-Cl cotransporter [Acidimicrobiia bacterium]
MTPITQRFRRTQPRPEKLGTFLGVFTPSILTILGVILFLRTGWVVGNVGLIGAVTIVIIANAVTFATALSVSTVATNMRVGAGGAYFIISRSLGVEIGAAIGIPLFLAQAFSVTLYAFGLAESLQLIWPDLPLRPTATITVLVVALLAARGADLALRLQLPIMAGILLALVALGVGVVRNMPETVDLTGSSTGLGFWPVFAVFFPAVTGIMAGVSLSGDLERPERSIPRGSIAAVLVGFVVYLGTVIALGLAASPEELINDNLLWFTLAGGIGFLIFPGLWGAIFSSAVGSILGAPRTLEAMVDDRVLPRFIGKKLPRIDGPGMPLVVSIAVALGAVLLGDLNAVAPVLTMFFLTTYGMVNLVAGVERLTGDPSFRPSMKVPSWISLAGAFGCFWVMFLINPLALAVAVVVEVGVYLIMRRRAMAAPWGDLRRGALMALVRSTVLQLRRLPEDPRNWRPNILLFAGDARKRMALVQFAAWLVQDRGILTVSDLQVGSLEELGPSVQERTESLNRDLDEMGVVAFGEVDVVEDFTTGVIDVAQANGIAGIASNTVMFGWSDKTDRQAEVLRIIERLATIGMSAVICNARPFSTRKRRNIIVWWGGLQNNGDMLALFAHLMSLNPEWRDAQITLKSIATSDMMMERNRVLLEKVIGAARIDARIDILQRSEDVPISRQIFQESQSGDVVLMGLRATARGDEESYARRLEELAEGLPTVLFIRSAGTFRGRLLGEQPDEMNGRSLGAKS